MLVLQIMFFVCELFNVHFRVKTLHILLMMHVNCCVCVGGGSVAATDVM